MRKITGRKLWFIFGGDARGWDLLSNGSKSSWGNRAEVINSHVHAPDLDEQSNECPIPTLQEDD